jgi:hypothetical protein
MNQEEKTLTDRVNKIIDFPLTVLDKTEITRGLWTLLREREENNPTVYIFEAESQSYKEVTVHNAAGIDLGKRRYLENHGWRFYPSKSSWKYIVDNPSF